MSPSETMTIRIDAELKGRAEAAAKAEDRTLTDFVTRAMRQRISPTCDHCGRTDRPSGGAGLSKAFESFLAEMKANRSRFTVTTAGPGRPRAYCGTLVLNEPSQGLLLMLVAFYQGKVPGTAHLTIARGLVTGWQEDSSGTHQAELIGLGYVNGNDAAIRASLRTRRLQGGVTVRTVSDAICAMPGITIEQLRGVLGLYNVHYAAGPLHEAGLVATAGGQLRPLHADPDDQLQAARDAGIDVDTAF
jgi:hypothetical protein